MAAKIPVRFKRVAEAFDEVARARVCDSSGSDHSPETSSATDLSDLVNSFLERDDDDVGEGGDNEEVKEGNMHESENYCSDSETNDVLQSLLGCGDDDVKRNIHDEAEKAYRFIGNSSSPGFKRRLMNRLREKGFDAGLCKSKWEKTGRFPSGDYEYIDINICGTRYIIEVFLAGEFKIARPTDRYSALLANLPPIFIGTVEELKQAVKVMCRAIKKSMKKTDMHVPPWRRYGYVHAKWFGSYKRTINEFSIKKGSDYDEDSVRMRSVGFTPLPLPAASSYYCGREGFGSKVGSRVGYLAAAIDGTTMLL